MGTVGRLAIDDRGGTVHVRGEGLYDQATVEAFAVALDGNLARRRRAGQPVRVLVDLTGASVQRPEIAALLGRRMRAVHRPEHRVAMLCRSALHALQIRRVDAGLEHCIVTASVEEAERFLAGPDAR